MIVTLFIGDSINAITLPRKIGGQYWLLDPEVNPPQPLISIEGIDGQWVLQSNKQVDVLDHAGLSVRQVQLSPLTIYNLRMKEQQNTTIIFTESNTDDRQLYTKYRIEDHAEITIGRHEQNDITFSNPFVSGVHAKLSCRNQTWRIEDCNSSNGTFVNGRRIQDNPLSVGDAIYIMGLKVVIGSRLIAVNNPDGMLAVRTARLKPMTMDELAMSEEEEGGAAPQIKYFYRSPRFKRDIERVLFKVDSPPPNAIGEEMPLMLSLGPSVTLGLASMATALFAVNNAISNGDISRALPSIIMSCSMLLGSIMWPFISKKFDMKRRRVKEKLRQEKYVDYLRKVDDRLKAEASKQEEILRENHVTVAECIARIEELRPNLWERGWGQNDFLKVRVGVGAGRLLADVSYAEKKFTLDDDNLQNLMHELCESPKVLENVPVTLSLYKDYITGVIGERERLVAFAKGLIIQLTALYSYDEVKLAFIYDLAEEEDFHFVKWLPHVWSNDQTCRFVATNNNEVKEISSYIEREIEARSAVNDSDMEDCKPYYIIFAMSRPLALRAEMLKRVSAKKNINISVINFFGEMKNLPKECTMVVEVEGNNGKLIDTNDLRGQFIPFTPELDIDVDPRALSVKLANHPLEPAGSVQLPQMLTFLEMFRVGKVEHLNALTRWTDNDPTVSLQAEIGVDALGESFMLDLHERFHGPHGLVAGMTGSGKSEFIITYILSLAVNYHPHEVAFILIDYKGGGMAKSFEKLPHTAGIITNLDGPSIKRSLISIESELKRRQAIFADVSKQIGESNIDIYKYQRLYRDGGVSEPLQHLFIISDEFAELKTQQPEFMAKLVSAARIGRSLGIHLILATQKPSGVVDDQIWSNSRFRISLKVQERSDSMDMIKRPDAAELKATGRFYLQVGYNELFEMGQSAWAGGPYYQSDKVVEEKDDSVVVIDRNGNPIKQARMDKKRMLSNPRKQMDVITEYLGRIALEEQIKIRPLWLEAIPAIVLLDELKTKYANVEEAGGLMLNPVIGELDDPSNQRQSLLRLPISSEGNVVVYGSAGSGKSTFLSALAYSLIHEHTPEEVQLYMMDFGGETLRAFAKAPHVGDVVLSHEKEKVANLFGMLGKEFHTRKRLFADYGGDLLSYLSMTGKRLPSIVILIHNFTAFTEVYDEQEDAVSYLSREGTKYGLYFVLTTLATNGVRYRLLQNFKQLIALQMNDESDYATVIGKTDGLYPSKFKGRGLVKRDAILEFQTAHLTRESVPYAFIEQACSRLRLGWEGRAARKIPILPKVVDRLFLAEHLEERTPLRVPVGVESSTLHVHYYPFGEQYMHMIASLTDLHIEFANELAVLWTEHGRMDVTVLDAAQSMAGAIRGGYVYYSSAGDLENYMETLFDIVLHRHNSYKDALDDGMDIPFFEHKIIVIQSVVALRNVLSPKGVERLELILDKGEAKYKLTIVICEQSKQLSGLSFNKWYKRHVNEGSGIWLGNGIAEQFQLKPARNSPVMHEDIARYFGFTLQNGKLAKVKLLHSLKEDDDHDE